MGIYVGVMKLKRRDYWSEEEWYYITRVQTSHKHNLRRLSIQAKVIQYNNSKTKTFILMWYSQTTQISQQERDRDRDTNRCSKMNIVNNLYTLFTTLNQGFQIKKPKRKDTRYNKNYRKGKKKTSMRRVLWTWWGRTQWDFSSSWSSLCEIEKLENKKRN